MNIIYVEHNNGNKKKKNTKWERNYENTTKIIKKDYINAQISRHTHAKWNHTYTQTHMFKIHF